MLTYTLRSAEEISLSLLNNEGLALSLRWAASLEGAAAGSEKRIYNTTTAHLAHCELVWSLIRFPCSDEGWHRVDLRCAKGAA